MAPTTAQTARLFSPPASRPKRPQVSTGVRVPARVRRGSWTCALCLALTLTTTSIEDRVPALRRSACPAPCGSSRPASPRQSKPAERTAARCRRRRPPAPPRPGPLPGPRSSGLVFDPVAGIRQLVVLLDERGDELDDRPDLEVRLRAHSPGFGGVYGSGVPGLIGGSATSVFRNAPAAAATGCSHPAVREVDLVLLARVPLEVVDQRHVLRRPRSSRSRPA